MKRNLLSFIVIGLLTISAAFAQNKTITGKVTSADDGLPIPSVSVKVTGSSNAVQTNVNGTYSISVPANATSLTFSYVGMEAKTETIGSRSVINVALTSSNELNEVVITGYGSGRTVGTIVGSVATVNARVIENKPSANAFDALQGKVAGLQVFTSSGEPSAMSSVRLHGVGSLGASNTPLYLLDGIQIDPNGVPSLNPNDIESVSVLKDASSTSIYGARAANGVIYITTKKGNANNSSITVQSQMSVQNIANEDFYYSMMNTKELTDFWVKTGYRTQAQINTLLSQYNADTKWADYYYKKDAPLRQSDVTVSGGSGATTYYISGSFFDGESQMYRSGFERYTLRANLNTKVNDYIQFGLNLSGGSDNRQLNNQGSNSTNGGLSLLAQPFYSPYDANGNDYGSVQIPGWARYSPRYLADNQLYNNNTLQFNPSGYVQVKPFKGLTFRSQAGMDGYVRRITETRLPSYLPFVNNGTLEEIYRRNIGKTWTNTLEYKFNIGGKHDITALAGQEYVDETYSEFSGKTEGLTDDRLVLLGNGIPTTRTMGSNKTEYTYKSLFGRLEYAFNNRYFIDGSVRQDKSSRFGVGLKDAMFWSVGGMWRMKQESFMSDVTWIDDFTVRLSTGTSGNSAIGNYEHLATVGTTTYNGQNGFAISASGNPLLGWEKQQKTTLGIKTSFFNKLRVDLEIYLRETSSQLISVPYAATTGYTSIRSNVGALQNKGLDVTLGYDVWTNNAKKGFITPYVNLNFNKNKITELFQGQTYWNIAGTGVTWPLGQPVSFFYPMWKGVNPQNGNPEWYLPNPAAADRVNTRNDPNAVSSTFSEAALQQNTGIDRYPWFNGGFGFNSGFEGFTLDADFTFSEGKYMINNDQYFFQNPSQFPGFNQSKVVQDYWTTPGQEARFPRYGVQFTQFDDRLLQNASFIRLKTLQLAYNFPQSLLKSTRVLKGASIFFVGRNLLTFTDYAGPDPEVDSNLSLGVNPNTKQVGFGVRLKF